MSQPLTRLVFSSLTCSSVLLVSCSWERPSVCQSRGVVDRPGDGNRHLMGTGSPRPTGGFTAAAPSQGAAWFMVTSASIATLRRRILKASLSHLPSFILSSIVPYS
jgi:hypothetical protein